MPTRHRSDLHLAVGWRTGLRCLGPPETRRTAAECCGCRIFSCSAFSIIVNLWIYVRRKTTKTIAYSIAFVVVVPLKLLPVVLSLFDGKRRHRFDSFVDTLEA